MKGEFATNKNSREFTSTFTNQQTLSCATKKREEHIIVTWEASQEATRAFEQISRLQAGVRGVEEIEFWVQWKGCHALSNVLSCHLL